MTTQVQRILQIPMRDQVRGDTKLLQDVEWYARLLPMCDKELAINPNNAITLANKGIALDHLGKYTGAIECYDKAFNNFSKRCRSTK
jgi:tetratricopeptide (TPR) repeat protein